MNVIEMILNYMACPGKGRTKLCTYGFLIFKFQLRGNLMPPTRDLSFTGLDEFVNKLVAEKYKVKSSEEKPNVVRKNDDAPIIEELVSDNKQEDVSKPKIKKKTIRPSIAKIEFVKPKKQEKTAKKTVKQGNPQIDLRDQEVIDSGCSRHMTRNMSYLIDYKEIDGGYVAFEGNPKKGKSQEKMCDKKNSVLFNDTECIVLSLIFKLIDDSQVLLRVPRKNNMYSVDLKNIVPKGGLTCLFAKATSNESKLWHRRLVHLNFKTMNKLVKGNLVGGLPSKLFKNDQTCVACQKGKQHRASCKPKIENSISLSLHLLHMDLFGLTLVKSLMKKMYCLVVTDDYSRTPTLSFMRPFRCPVTILNTIDYLGKFDGMADEGFFIGHSLNSKTFRVFNSRTRIVEENLHIRFSDSTHNVVDPKSSRDDGSKTSSDDGKKVDGDPRKEIEYNELPFDPNILAYKDVSIFNLSRDVEDDDTVIVDNCKKRLGYKNCNAVPPPYTENFMPSTPDLSFTDLDEFFNKHVVENGKAKSSKEEPKVVRKNDDAPIIKEWVSDNEQEDVSQPKIEKKIVRPSIAKIKFVKSKQHEKTARKTI
nr:ribonuclease H-like domain-containing protein [Tanacetum cinerariifolium]